MAFSSRDAISVVVIARKAGGRVERVLFSLVSRPGQTTLAPARDLLSKSVHLPV